MLNEMGCAFDNLPQRMIYYFIATYPPLFPVDSDRATVEQQNAAHAYIHSIYQRLYDDPTLLGFTLMPDDSFADWEPQKVKPVQVTKMRGVIKKVDEFLAVFHQICLHGEIHGNLMTVAKYTINIKKNTIRQLRSFGLDGQESPDFYAFTHDHDTLVGLKLLADVSANVAEKPYLLFSRGIFDPSAPYNIASFRALTGDEQAYDRLIGYFETNGFRRIDNRWQKICLDFVKDYGPADDPIKSGWSERTHSGIEFWWEEIRHNQLTIGLRTPYFAALLNHMEIASNQVKRYVVNQSKKCDNCGYCTQTDKTGNRPKAYVPVVYESQRYDICPLFCGFQHRWHKLNDQIVDDIIAFMDFIDVSFQHKRSKAITQ